MCRSDYEESDSGVFSASFRFGKKNEGQKLTMCFYSPSAQSVIKDINKMLQSNLKFNIEQKLPSKHKKCSNIHGSNEMNGKNIQDVQIDADKAEESSVANSRVFTIGPTLMKFKNLPSSILDTSISSLMSSKSDLVPYESSDSDDDFLNPEPCSAIIRNESTSELQCQIACSKLSFQLGSDKNEDDNPSYPNKGKSRMDERLQSVASNENIYSDIPWIEGGSSEDGLDDDIVYEELLGIEDQILDDELRIPPVPPPRRTRRPTTLALEELSFNIESALEDAQSTPSTSSIPSSQKSSRSWLKPFKGMKKIFSKERISKSSKPSPTDDQSVKSKVKRVVSAPMFIPEKMSPLDQQRNASYHSESGSPITFLPKGLHSFDKQINEIVVLDIPSCDMQLITTLNENVTMNDEVLRLLRDSAAGNLQHGIIERKSLPATTVAHTHETDFLRMRSKSLSLDVETNLILLMDERDNDYHKGDRNSNVNKPSNDTSANRNNLFADQLRKPLAKNVNRKRTISL